MYRNEEVARMAQVIRYYAEYRYCADCGDEQAFEQVHADDCLDAPGECPEWACTACGAALIVGMLLPGYTAADSVSRAA
jgi:hypothetical protein